MKLKFGKEINEWKKKEICGKKRKKQNKERNGYYTKSER